MAESGVVEVNPAPSEVERSASDLVDTEDRSGTWGTSRYGSSDWSSGDSSDWGTSGAWGAAARVAHTEKQSYQERLESARNDDVFKYVFLINSASVEQYVSQSRAQATTSFALSRMAALAGFALLVLSILIGLGSEITGHSLSIAYLSGVGGVITEFIAGVFFWIYNRTLRQINMFYAGMMNQQHEALNAIGRSSERAADARKEESLAWRASQSTGETRRA